MNDWLREALITLAGPTQDRLDRQFGGGWKRHRGPLEQVGAHEAAHALLAVILEKKIENATVVPAGTTLGHVRFVTEIPRSAEERIATLSVQPKISEFRQAVREFVQYLKEQIPKPGFREGRAAVREFLANVEEFLRDNRGLIDALASHLAWRGIMSGVEIEEFIRYYAVDKTSLAPVVAPKTRRNWMPACCSDEAAKLQLHSRNSFAFSLTAKRRQLGRRFRGDAWISLKE